MKRFISFLLVLTLTCAALPMTALADGLEELVRTSALSAVEKEQARIMAGKELDSAYWQEGQPITRQSTPRQVQGYLQWLLTNEVEGLLLSMRDTGELLEQNGSPMDSYQRDQTEAEVEKLRNELAYYWQVLEDNRTTLGAELEQLGEGSLLNQYQHNRKARQAMEALQEAMDYVIVVCTSNSDYQTQIDAFRTAFHQSTETANFPTSSSLAQVTAEADQKTSIEAQSVSTSDKEFSVRVISTSQFAIVVKGIDDKRLSRVKVTLTSAKDSTQTKTAYTDQDGMALFEVKDFSPDQKNTVCVNVALSLTGVQSDYYGERESHNLYVKGGYSIPFKLTRLEGDKPYLKMASFNGVDALSQQQVIYFSTKNDANFNFDLCVELPSDQPAAKGTITMEYYSPVSGTEEERHQIQKPFETGKTVTFRDKWCRIFAPGRDVTFRIYLEGGKEVMVFTPQLVVEQAVVNEPMTDQSQAFSVLSSFFSFTLPDEIPFIGGTDLSLTLPEPSRINLMITPYGDVFLRMGDPIEVGNWKESTPYIREDHYEREAILAAQQAAAAEGDIFANWPVKETTFLREFKATIAPIAGFFGKYGKKPGEIDHGVFELSGYGGFQASLNLNICKTFWVSGLPIMVALDMAFRLGAAPMIDLQWDWDAKETRLSNLRMDQGSGLDLNILMELGISGGLGVQNVASAVIRFFGRMALFARVGGDATEATLTLSIGFQILLQFLMLKVSQNIWTGSETFTTHGKQSVDSGGADTPVVYEKPEDQQALALLCEDINSTQAYGSAANADGNGMVQSKQLFQDAASSAQSIQYVTLTSGSQTHTYGFWITPCEHPRYFMQEKLMWFNMDDPSQRSEIETRSYDLWYPQKTDVKEEERQTMRMTHNDYAFAVRADGDMVAVAVVGGTIKDQVPTAGKCSCDIAVLQMQADGSLKLIDYKTIETYRKLSLINPVIYLVRYADNDTITNHYYVSAGCGAMNGEGDTSSSVIYCMDLEGWNDKGLYSPKRLVSRVVADGLPESMVSFASAMPTNAKITTANDGDEGNADTVSNTSYYSLTKVNAQAGQEVTSYGSLYLNLSGTHKAIDNNVAFIAPLTSHKLTGVVDNNNFLFYLKRGTDKHGAEQFELMSACIHSDYKGVTVTTKNHGITVPGGGFNVMVLQKGNDYGVPYLYWIEYAEEATGDAKTLSTGDTNRRTLLRAVTFDRAAQVMYGPFTLAELDTGATGEGREQNPINGVYLSHALQKGSGDSAGRLRLYYSRENSKRSSTSYLTYQDIYEADVELTAGAEFLGIMSEEPCVNPDSDAALLFTLQNTGNLPISGFTIELQSKNKSGQWTKFGELDMDCSNPSNSTFTFFKQYYDGDQPWNPSNGNGPVALTFDRHVATRINNMFDKTNGDLWVIQTATQPMPLNGSRSSAQSTVTTTVKSTGLLMPEGIHTYKAMFKIPADWNGSVQLMAKMTKLRVLQQMGSAVMDETSGAPVNAAPVELIVAEDGTVQYPAVNDGETLISVQRKANQYDTQYGDSLGVGRSDLNLRCNVYVDDSGKEFVRANIVSRSTHGGSQPPTLSVTLGNRSAPVFTYTFQSAINEGFGYTVDIPAATLLDGAEGATATFTLTNPQPVSNGPEQVDGSEFSMADNQRVLKLGNWLRIVQHPADVQGTEGGSASFAVTAEGGRKPYHYQWHCRTEGGDWTPVIGATGDTLMLDCLTAVDNGREYCCLVTDANGDEAVSHEALLTVGLRPPLTGDGAPLALWAVMALLSLMGAAWFVTKSHRNG